MKLIKFTTIALAFMLAGGMAFNAEAAKKRPAAKKARTAASSAVTAIKGDVHTYGNGALTTQEFLCKKGKFSILVEYPIGGNPELVNAVRNWIKSKLDDKFVGSLDTPDALMKKTFAMYKKENVEAEEQIKVSYSNDKVVTVRDTGYFYMGGAHGMPVDVSATFSLSDGKALTADMLPSISVMRPFIVNGLAEYVECPVNQLQDAGVYVDELEMGVPFVMSDGLHVIYGAYEIGPYSLGMPDVVIPFSKLNGVVSSSVASKYF